MSVRQKSLKGTVVLSLGEGVGYACSFVRNMILARMLTKADFGITATLSMVIVLLEISSKLGISRFIIRDKEGNEPEFVGAAHLVQAISAILGSLCMVALARPMSFLFGIPEHTEALYVLATVPLLNGFSHLDVKRYERELRFGPSVICELVPQIIMTLAAWPSSKWFGDYRAVLLLLIIKAALTCACSHVLAERRYRWRRNNEFIWRMLKFGWPLFLTGFLQFGVMQGDQFLIASFYTMSDLGPYAAAAALALAPSFLFARIFNSVALPVMAEVQDVPTEFQRRYRFIIAIMCAFSAAYCAGMILGSEALMRLIYGAKYAGSGVILGWLAAANAFRNIRIAPAIAALARGDSQNQLVSNLARVVAIIPAIFIAVTGQPVWLIACSGLVGEAVACWVSFRRLLKRDAVPLSISLVPTGWITLAVVISGFASLGLSHRLSTVSSLVLAILGALTFGAIMIAVSPVLRREASFFWSNLKKAGPKGCIRILAIPKPPSSSFSQ